MLFFNLFSTETLKNNFQISHKYSNENNKKSTLFTFLLVCYTIWKYTFKGAVPMADEIVYKKAIRKADKGLEGKVIAKHGKQTNQKLKPYVVLQ